MGAKRLEIRQPRLAAQIAFRKHSTDVRRQFVRPRIGLPVPTVVREYATLDFDSLDDIVGAFVDETNASSITAVTIGVAGPVTGHVARLTNVPWLADISVVGDRFDRCPVQLLNDLEAMAS